MKGYNWATREATTQIVPARHSRWSEIELRVVAQYAREMAWKVPPKFAAIGLGAALREEKELSKKERRTMLVLLAALLNKHRYDWTQHTTAAKKLMGLVDLLGAKPLGRRTIENVLKEVELLVNSLKE
jgi:hypothetical protein